MNKNHILDPLWIIKGGAGLDPEYYKYILLAANKKYRKNLDNDDVSDFYEILFHSLNLNNLAIEGSLFNFKLNPIWKDPKLKKIRNNLRELYNLPDDLVEIFKNANYILTRLMLDYLETMIDSIDDASEYFINNGIHKEKEIFIIINKEGSMIYDIWKLKFDKRYKFGHKLSNIISIKLSSLKPNSLQSAIEKENNSELSEMISDVNVIFMITKNSNDNKKLAESMAMSIVFSNCSMIQEYAFEPKILIELYDILNQEKVLPFTMKLWT